MIDVKYDTNEIKVNLQDVSKYNDNLPYKFKVIKHVSGEIQWECELSDNWFATYPNTEIFDVEITDSEDNILYTKKWDINYGNRFYKSLWLYNKNLISKGVFPKGLVIGTHDGEFGEWVPVVLKRDCDVVLVEASDMQYNKLYNNYKGNPQVKMIKDLITPDGGDVELVEVSEDGIVKVKLTGACHGCPMSQLTLKMGIEKALKQAIPDIKEVQSV